MYMTNALAAPEGAATREEPEADALARLYAGESLDAFEAERLFAALVAGRMAEPQIAAMLVALKIKGETTQELIGAARVTDDQFARLTVEFLARTGLRRGEFLNLTVDSVVQIGAAYWLHVPLGKLRTDRYIPLHPQLKELLAASTIEASAAIYRQASRIPWRAWLDDTDALQETFALGDPSAPVRAGQPCEPVDISERIVSLGHLHDLADRGDIAVHRIKAFENDQLHAFATGLDQQLLRRATSLCRQTFFSQPERRMPSIMEI